MEAPMKPYGGLAGAVTAESGSTVVLGIAELSSTEGAGISAVVDDPELLETSVETAGAGAL